MGDMADFVNSGVQWNYIDPDESPELQETFDNEFTFSKRTFCRYCYQKGLKWYIHTTGKWRLFNSDGTLHNCRDYYK